MQLRHTFYPIRCCNSKCQFHRFESHIVGPLDTLVSPMSPPHSHNTPPYPIYRYIITLQHYNSHHTYWGRKYIYHQIEEQTHFQTDFQTHFEIHFQPIFQIQTNIIRYHYLSLSHFLISNNFTTSKYKNHSKI